MISLDFHFLSSDIQTGDQGLSSVLFRDSKCPFKMMGPVWSSCSQMPILSLSFPNSPRCCQGGIWLPCRLSSYWECVSVCKWVRVCVSLFRKTASPGPTPGASPQKCWLRLMNQKSQGHLHMQGQEWPVFAPVFEKKSFTSVASLYGLCLTATWLWKLLFISYM